MKLKLLSLASVTILALAIFTVFLQKPKTRLHIRQNNNTLVCVVDDSITNSVFAGQVIAPLQAYYQEHPETNILIISFEKYALDSSLITNIIPSEFSYALCNKLPFMGMLSLAPGIFQVQQLLKQLDSYNILARGPIAGYIACNALDNNKCKKLTVQARGLLAAEYAFTRVDTSNSISKLLHNWRHKQYYSIEKAAYAPKNITIPFEIESVSLALKEYLIDEFDANSTHISLAKQDIPPSIDAKLLNTWRTQVRKELKIPENAYVYCYNGSVKPWQDAKDIVAMFMDESQNHPNTYFVAYTQNKTPFITALKNAGISDAQYRVLSVNHKDMYRYLAAGDTGLMYRSDHIISWVARPVKVMEYQAAGLEVVHNNTVAWLCNNEYKVTA